MELHERVSFPPNDRRGGKLGVAQGDGHGVAPTDASTARRLDAGQGWNASLAGGYLDGSGVGGVYTAATGDIALNGIDDQLGTGQRALAGVGGVLTLAPLAPAGLRGVVSGGRAIGNGSRALAPRINPANYRLVNTLDFQTLQLGSGLTPGSVGLRYNAPRDAANVVNDVGTYGRTVSRSDVPFNIDPRHPLLRSAPDHHVFPQAHRDWFRRRGIDIDLYTMRLDEGTHGALHFGHNIYGSGGWWSHEMMGRLMNREAALGRNLTKREILVVGAEMRRQANLSQVKVRPYRSSVE